MLWAQQSQQKPDRGGLASSIGAEETVDAATRHLQRHILDAYVCVFVETSRAAKAANADG